MDVGGILDIDTKGDLLVTCGWAIRYFFCQEGRKKLLREEIERREAERREREEKR